MGQPPPISLGEALPDEIKRVIDLMVEYARLGPAGHIGLSLMRIQVFLALEAYKTQDLVLMMRVYEELKGFE